MSPQIDDEVFEKDSSIHSKDKKLYINKLIGKVLIGVLWTVLIVAHFIGLRLIKPHLLY